MLSVGALSVYFGLFQVWYHKLIKYIMGKHHRDKTIKQKYFLKPMCAIIYYQNQLKSLF